jgi:anti-anti-sigma regulatory factor
MSHGYRHIDVELHDTVAVVRLIKPRLDEQEIYQLFQEVQDVARVRGCPRVVLCLGPKAPDCLYSVFLAKLISLQRRLNESGGGLKLCQCGPQVVEILDACLLLDRFDLVPDPAAAVGQWGS